jgi:AraC family transcriptional regulator
MQRPPQLEAGRFFGLAERRRSAAGLRFVESRYADASRLPEHSHANAHFCFVLEGAYEERIGGRCYEREPLALAYQPAGVTHAERHHGPGRHLLIELGDSVLRGLEDICTLPVGPIDLSHSEAVHLAQRLHLEFTSPDDLSPLAMEGLVLELFAETVRAERIAGRPRWLALVDEVLCARFRDPPGVDELARTAGVHPVHLARVFRSAHGCTIARHVRRLRTEYASRRLLESGDRLAQIAVDAGFADQSHFGRCFKQVTGETPARFRARRSRR